MERGELVRQTDTRKRRQQCTLTTKEAAGGQPPLITWLWRTSRLIEATRRVFVVHAAGLGRVLEQLTGGNMTLAIIIFLLATAVLMLVTIPFVMMLAEIEDLWANIRFWAVVAAAWAVVWFTVSYGR
jgi:hypothetical protein